MQLRNIFVGVGGHNYIGHNYMCSFAASSLAWAASSPLLVASVRCIASRDAHARLRTFARCGRLCPRTLAGELPDFLGLSSLLKIILASFGFLNIDVSATRPGCGGTKAT